MALVVRRTTLLNSLILLEYEHVLDNVDQVFGAERFDQVLRHERLVLFLELLNFAFRHYAFDPLRVLECDFFIRLGVCDGMMFALVSCVTGTTAP